MRDLGRLVDESTSDFERAVLASSAEDGPEAGACNRALAGLGLATTAVAVAASTQAAAVASGSAAGAGTSSLVPTAAKGSAVLLAKWTGVVVIGSAIAIGSVQYVRGVDERGTTVSSAAPVPRDKVPSTTVPPARAAAQVMIAASAAAKVENPPTVAAGAPSTADRGATAPAAAHEVVIPAPGAVTNPAPRNEGNAASAAPTSPAPESKLEPVAMQLEALSTIRAALAAGDAPGAIKLIDAFEAQHPSSPLIEEATVLRIDALVDAGRRAEAAAVAGAFAKAYPTSAYGDHVRSKINSR